ncbi:MAG: GxxExxY protein [Gemmatimonadaceae bacterium]
MASGRSPRAPRLLHAPRNAQQMFVDECTGDVVDSAIKVHSALGPGLLESAYAACLAHELRVRGREVETQLPLPIEYDGIKIDAGYRIDMLVDGIVVVELKAVAKMLPIHHAQLLSYLKLSGRAAGLLINFHEVHLKDGLKRIVAFS